jgi:hypothetical protein
VSIFQQVQVYIGVVTQLLVCAHQRYLSADSTLVKLAARGDAMVLRSAGIEGWLLRTGDDVLASDHPGFLDAPLHLQREADRGGRWVPAKPLLVPCGNSAP